MKQIEHASALNERDHWSQHWEEYAESAQQNPAQEYRRDLVISWLRRHSSQSEIRLLDIGSGQGDLAADLRKSFPSVRILGLELSESGVAISKAKVPGAHFVQRNLLQNEPIPEDQRHWATHAVCSEVIEHVDDPAKLLSSARDYVMPDCLLFVTAPGGPMSAFDKHIGHRKHFRPQEIAGLLQSAGWKTEGTAKAGFPFFNLYRMVVILRGRRLIEDVRSDGQKSASFLARLLMRVFRFLFRFNSASSHFGWQMVAEARLPQLERGNNS